MANNWKWVTDDMFQEELERQVNNMSAAELLAVPNIAAILQEELNNSVLEGLAESNDRCPSCGSEFNEEGECPC